MAPILVVDDHDDTRMLMRTRLEMDGYSVLEAENGKAALELLTAAGAPEPCIIVLDLEMPVMTGSELLAILKGDHRLAKIPVVVVSGSQTRPELVDALDHKAIVASLPKPCNLESLMDKIAAYARKHCAP